MSAPTAVALAASFTISSTVQPVRVTHIKGKLIEAARNEARLTVPRVFSEKII
jgi:hypothetical protein